MHQDERVLLRRVTSGVLGGEGRIKLPPLELLWDDNDGEKKEVEEEDEEEEGAKMLEIGSE